MLMSDRPACERIGPPSTEDEDPVCVATHLCNVFAMIVAVLPEGDPLAPVLLVAYQSARVHLAHVLTEG